jgi:hypothetical protein
VRQCAEGFTVLWPIAALGAEQLMVRRRSAPWRREPMAITALTTTAAIVTPTAIGSARNRIRTDRQVGAAIPTRQRRSARSLFGQEASRLTDLHAATILRRRSTMMPSLPQTRQQSFNNIRCALGGTLAHARFLEFSDPIGVVAAIGRNKEKI